MIQEKTVKLGRKYTDVDILISSSNIVMFENFYKGSWRNSPVNKSIFRVDDNSNEYKVKRYRRVMFISQTGNL